MPLQHIVTIDATHAGFVNGNNTWYLEDHMRAAIDTWTVPYNRPVLRHHDAHSDAIGYVVDAEYIDKKSGGKNGPRGHIRLTAVICESDAVNKIKDGRYNTVSVSADAGYARCSICNHKISEEGLCEHVRGKVYDGKKCYWNIGALKYKEVSYVNAPADEYACTLKIEEKETNGIPMTNTKDSETKSVNLKFTFADEDVKVTPITDGKTENDTENDTIDHSTDKEAFMPELTLQEILAKDEVSAHIKSEVEKATKDYKTQLSGMKALDEKATAQEASIETKDKEIETQKESITTLEDEVQKLKEQVHKNLVDKVYDLKVSLQKKDAVDLKDEKEVEAYKAELSKRTDESLSDTISDLSVEEPVKVGRTITDSQPDEIIDEGEVKDEKETQKVVLSNDPTERAKQVKDLFTNKDEKVSK